MLEPSISPAPSEAKAPTPILHAQHISKRFGGVCALDNVSLSVQPGSITGLIGPNGAGKTTLFTVLAAFTRPDEGIVVFDGKPIHHWPPHQLAHHGLVRTFQVARVLSRLSVLDNVLLAYQRHPGEQFWQVWARPQQVYATETQQRQAAMDILESVGLATMAHAYAGALSGGQRKLLELARTLMVQPKLILLDEPAAGVNPTLILQICDYIRHWNQAGISFLIIEHNMDVIMSLCDHVWVLAAGRNLADGSPTAVQRDPHVLAAYLGE
ncbi:MAG: ABC transporter ATP-binding protein [Leptolyngbyaceae bacterium]|nr:ABC transporter ATP-binding protein [Leptolyngbyaceae bacterium]